MQRTGDKRPDNRGGKDGLKRRGVAAVLTAAAAVVFALSASSVATIFLPSPSPSLENVSMTDDLGSRLPREAFKTLAFLAANRNMGDSTRFTVPVWDTEARISGRFGWRDNPITGEGREFHSGVDIAARKGSQVVASRDGRVSASYDDKYMGQTVEIGHADGTTSIYAHMNDRVASVGEVVARGETIGHVGYTGRSTGPHLHFAIRRDGNCIDPMPYLWLDAARLALVKD